MMYPSHVYNIREDVTKANKRAYDARQELINKKCEEINPDYWHLGLRQRREIRRQAEEEVV